MLLWTQRDNIQLWGIKTLYWLILFSKTGYEKDKMRLKTLLTGEQKFEKKL